MKSIGNVNIDTRLSKTPPVTYDLPGSGGTPQAIDLTNEKAAFLSLCLESDSYITWTNAGATAAATALGSDATRAKWPAGLYDIPIAGNYDQVMYVKSQAVSATTDGIIVAFVDAN